MIVVHCELRLFDPEPRHVERRQEQQRQHGAYDCESARGPDVDRHVKLLIQFALEGSLSGAYSQSNILRGGEPTKLVHMSLLAKARIMRSAACPTIGSSYSRTLRSRT